MNKRLTYLYKTVILEHTKQPHHKGELDPYNAERTVYNPSCGDTIKVQIKIQDGRLEAVHFNGSGCAISQASASIMTDLLQDLTISEAKAKIQLFHHMIQGKAGIDLEPLGEGVALKGVVQFPTRIRCAQIAWQAVEEAINSLDEVDTKESL